MPTDPPDWYEQNKDRAKNEFNRVSPDDSKSPEKNSQEDKGQGKGSEMVQKDKPVDYPHPNGPTYNASNAQVYDQRLQKERDQAQPPGSPDDSKLTYAQKQRQERDGSNSKTEQSDKSPRSYDEYYDEEKGRAKKDFNRASQKGRAKRDFNRASKPK